jgi:hypothetical protein
MPQQVAWWFDSDVREAVERAKGDKKQWQRFARKRHYPHVAKLYFDMVYFSPEQAVRDETQ